MLSNGQPWKNLFLTTAFTSLGFNLYNVGLFLPELEAQKTATVDWPRFIHIICNGQSTSQGRTAPPPFLATSAGSCTYRADMNQHSSNKHVWTCFLGW